MVSTVATHPAPDSRYAWWRLAASLAISTIGGVGLWSAVVVLPTIQAEFGIDRGSASLPYTATLIVAGPFGTTQRAAAFTLTR